MDFMISKSEYKFLKAVQHGIKPEKMLDYPNVYIKLKDEQYIRKCGENQIELLPKGESAIAEYKKSQKHDFIQFAIFLISFATFLATLLPYLLG